MVYILISCLFFRLDERMSDGALFYVNFVIAADYFVFPDKA